MTRKEQIKEKAHELGQVYFPDECNIWARQNYEAQNVESACMKMAEWIDEHPKEGMVSLDKVCEWLDNNFMNLIWGATRSVYSGNFATVDEMIESFNNAMRK